jgi:hypothetical protein
MRQRLNDSLTFNPYDPETYIHLAALDNVLGFCDIAAANAHKALTLVKCGLSEPESKSIYPSLPTIKVEVRNTIGKRSLTTAEIIINDELYHLRLLAYRSLLEALCGCAAYYEALFVVAKRALSLYPYDDELDHFRMIAKGGYRARLDALKDTKCPIATLSEIMKKGKIAQKRYPWLDESLYWRSEEMVRKVNKELGDKCNCEVRPVVFDKPENNNATSKTDIVNPDKEAATSESFKKGGDVGPLGIFAKRDIKEDEIVLIDMTLLNTSNAPSSELQYCDTCNSCLNPPYLRPKEVIWASCCDRVAFCSTTCRDNAVKGYHTVLCGKDLDWLYQGVKDIKDLTKEGVAQAWRPVSFARLASVVIADSKMTDEHPLQHHLLTRMAANYESPEKIVPVQLYDFEYQENVVSPCDILLTLGFDIFERRDWDPEVIQTAFWRMDNNANMGRTSIYPKGEPLPHPSHLPTPPSSHKFSCASNTLPSPILTRPRTVRPILNTININPIYLFFNHSCTPNIFWHSALPSSDVGMKWLANGKGGLLRPGNSAVKCQAIRDIKAGEELKITYVGDPLGKDGVNGRKETRLALEKWFVGGCGCEICERENAEEERRAAKEKRVVGN